MKKILYFTITLLLTSIAMQACHDDETYAEQKDKERKAVAHFLSRSPLVLLNPQKDTLLNIPGINVITEEQFEEQDSTTDVSKNEFVLFRSSGIYMQIVRQGNDEKIRIGEAKRIVCRYWEYNILGDSLQTTDLVPFFATNPEIMDVSNNSGTFAATFNTTIYEGGAMYLTYNSPAVPMGWLVPFNYIRVGRQNAPDAGVAKVRLIVPHDKGQVDATSNVYPCFYEITYQETRY